MVGLISCESGNDYIETIVEEGTPGSIVHTDWDHKKAQQLSGKSSPKTGTSETKSVKPKSGQRLTPASKNTYQLQLGAFVNKANAQNLIKRIEKKGYQPYIEDSDFKGKKWYFVKIGSYRRYKDAALNARNLTPYLNSDIIILKNKKLLERVKAPVMAEKKSEPTVVKSNNNPGISKEVAKKESKQQITEVISQNTAQTPGTLKSTQKASAQVASQSLSEKPVLKKIPKVFKSKANPKADKASNPYSFQIGGLYTLENAKKQLKRFQAKGYAPYLEIVNEEITNEKWYSVRIGRFKYLQDAVDEASIFSIKEQMPAIAQPLNY